MKLVREGNDVAEDEKTPLVDGIQEDEEENEAYSSYKDRLNSPELGSEEELTDEKADKKLTSAQAFFNIVNMVQGMGTLGIPFAIRAGGYITVLFILFIGVVTKHTATMIIDCQYDEAEEDCCEDGSNSQQQHHSPNQNWDECAEETDRLVNDDPRTLNRVKTRPGFAAIGRSVWTKYGAKIVSGIQLVHLFGACVLYLILIASFLQNVVPPDLLSADACMLAAGAMLLPTTLLTSFNAISWLSFVSIIFMDVVFVSLLTHSLARIQEWKIDTLPFIDVEGLCIANCIILFSFVAHPYLPRIEGSMESPEKFNTVASRSFASATLTKILFGLALACHYGKATHQRVTLNTPVGRFRTFLDTLLACSGLLSFAMPTNVIMNIIHHSDLEMFAKIFTEKRLKGIMTWSEKFVDIGMRIILIAFATMIALALPEFSLLMAVFGSVTAVSMVLLLPAIFHTVIKRRHLSPTSILINYTIVGFGLVSSFVGLLSSMDAVRKAMAAATAETN